MQAEKTLLCVRNELTGLRDSIAEIALLLVRLREIVRSCGDGCVRRKKKDIDRHDCQHELIGSAPLLRVRVSATKRVARHDRWLTKPHSADQSKRARREAKSSNRFGKPVILKSKTAAAVLDPHSASNSIFIAESAGSVRRVNVDVSMEHPALPP